VAPYVEFHVRKGGKRRPKGLGELGEICHVLLQRHRTFRYWLPTLFYFYRGDALGVV